MNKTEMQQLLERQTFAQKQSTRMLEEQEDKRLRDQHQVNAVQQELFMKKTPQQLEEERQMLYQLLHDLVTTNGLRAKEILGMAERQRNMQQQVGELKQMATGQHQAIRLLTRLVIVLVVLMFIIILLLAVHHRS